MNERHHLIPIAGIVVLLLVLLFLLLLLRRERGEKTPKAPKAPKPPKEEKPKKEKRRKADQPSAAPSEQVVQHGLAPTFERLRAEEARLDERQAAMAAAEADFERVAEERVARLTEWEQTLAVREAAIIDREANRQEAYSARELRDREAGGRPRLARGCGRPGAAGAAPALRR